MIKPGAVLLGLALFLPGAARAGQGALPNGYGKATWGMSRAELLSAYRIVLAPPPEANGEGVWAVEGPSPGELTVSGAAIGEEEVRSVSFGFHPRWGLTIVHVRLKQAQPSQSLESWLRKEAARYGPPTAQEPGSKAAWENGTTHLELTFHRVSPLHPSPSDHLALVLWSVALRSKIEAEE